MLRLYNNHQRLDMTKFRGKYRIESTRLQNWDYTSPGYYFVTICTKFRQLLFGELEEGDMRLSPVGEIAWRYWADIPSHFANANLDEFVVMPNHVHGILILAETQHAASLQEPTTGRKFGPLQPRSLSTIIRSYKSAVTRWARKNGYEDFAWQARFYDHIILGESSLHSIRQYIQDNPTKWDQDENNPDNLKNK